MRRHPHHAHPCGAQMTLAGTPGIEAWLRDADPALRVGLLSHQAALLTTGETSAQAVRRVFGKNLRALFAPEHGYFGALAAGEPSPTLPHPIWKIPVHSLYGPRRKPDASDLAGLDLLIVDLRDIGVRCYTYLATLKLTLEACAERGLPCLVCERPIPCHGLEDGPIAEPAHFSFVAPCALPLVHGRTQVELARWLGPPHLEAPMTPGADAAFIPPSPTIRDWEAARLYPATVFAEALPQLDVGRDGPWAWRTLQAPWIDGPALADALNAKHLPGIRFFDFTQADDRGGIRLHLTDPAVFRPWATALAILRALQAAYGPERLFEHPSARPAWFTKLLGTDAWTCWL